MTQAELKIAKSISYLIEVRNPQNGYWEQHKTFSHNVQEVRPTTFWERIKAAICGPTLLAPARKDWHDPRESAITEAKAFFEKHCTHKDIRVLRKQKSEHDYDYFWKDEVWRNGKWVD